MGEDTTRTDHTKRCTMNILKKVSDGTKHRVLCVWETASKRMWRQGVAKISLDRGKALWAPLAGTCTLSYRNSKVEHTEGF